VQKIFVGFFGLDLLHSHGLQNTSNKKKTELITAVTPAAFCVIVLSCIQMGFLTSTEAMHNCREYNCWWGTVWTPNSWSDKTLLPDFDVCCACMCIPNAKCPTV
jgi:hypothetical protein